MEHDRLEACCGSSRPRRIVREVGTLVECGAASGPGVRRDGHAARRAKVSDHCVTVGGDEDIRRLEVLMDNSKRVEKEEAKKDLSREELEGSEGFVVGHSKD